MSLDGMRPSVVSAWPGFIRPFEGVLNIMYLDTKEKVTTGTGNLIDSIPAAQALKWYKRDDTQATDEEVAAEFKMIKSHTELAHTTRAGWAYYDVATLYIKQETIDALLTNKTDEFWKILKQSLPSLSDFPADAQLCVMDEAWQNGPAYLEKIEKDGSYTWTNTRAGLLAQDFNKAASAVPGSGPRADRRKKLFLNAAKVVELGLDRSRLWDLEEPVAPPVIPDEYVDTYVPSNTSIDMDRTNMRDVYFSYGTDQKLKPGENTLQINEKHNTSVVVGPNDGVDLLAGLWFNKVPPAGTRAFFRIVDYKEGDTKTKHDRLSITPNRGAQFSYKGAIPNNTVAGRSNRLRIIVDVPEGVTDLVVGYLQVSGWKL